VSAVQESTEKSVIAGLLAVIVVYAGYATGVLHR